MARKAARNSHRNQTESKGGERKKNSKEEEEEDDDDEFAQQCHTALPCLALLDQVPSRTNTNASRPRMEAYNGKCRSGRGGKRTTGPYYNKRKLSMARIS